MENFAAQVGAGVVSALLSTMAIGIYKALRGNDIMLVLLRRLVNSFDNGQREGETASKREGSPSSLPGQQINSKASSANRLDFGDIVAIVMLFLGLLSASSVVTPGSFEGLLAVGIAVISGVLAFFMAVLSARGSKTDKQDKR